MKKNGEFVSPRETLQGATGGMANAGTMTGVSDTYGADLGVSATNRMGSMSAATKSDDMDACCSQASNQMTS